MQNFQMDYNNARKQSNADATVSEARSNNPEKEIKRADNTSSNSFYNSKIDITIS